MTDISDRSVRKRRIAHLNDHLRKTGSGGLTFVTQPIGVRGHNYIERVLTAVAAFDDFTEDNDPHGEHDFGAVVVDGERLFWKIDYYEPTLRMASLDPANSSVTVRVLTIMFADEY